MNLLLLRLILEQEAILSKASCTANFDLYAAWQQTHVESTVFEFDGTDVGNALHSAPLPRFWVVKQAVIKIEFQTADLF